MACPGSATSWLAVEGAGDSIGVSTSRYVVVHVFWFYHRSYHIDCASGGEKHSKRTDGENFNGEKQIGREGYRTATEESTTPKGS